MLEALGVELLTVLNAYSYLSHIVYTVYSTDSHLSTTPYSGVTVLLCQTIQIIDFFDPKKGVF